MSDTKRSLTRAWVLLACVAVGSAPVPGRADAEVTTIRLEDRASDWVLDEATGRIFACLAEKGEVAEYDPATGSELRRFKVGLQPRQLLVKGRRLVVGVADGPALWVLDLQSNQLEGHVRLEGGELADITCSRANNPYVYAVCRDPGRLCQVDIQQREVRRRTPTQRWPLTNASGLVMSADGRHALVCSGPRWKSHAGLADVQEADFTFRGSDDSQTGPRPFVAGPSSRYWSIGDRIFPLHMTRQPSAALRQLASSPVAIHPGLDMVVSLRRQRNAAHLVFEKFTQPGELKAVELQPVDLAPEKRESSEEGPFRDDPTLQWDVARGRVFFGSGTIAHVVPLVGLELPQQPVLRIRSPAPGTIATGSSLEFPLALTNAELRDRVAFKLLDAPPGMRIDDQRNVVWKPTADQVGVYDVGIQAAWGESTDAVRFSVRVVSPHVDLGVVASQLAVDEAGGRAVVAGVAYEDVQSEDQAADANQLVLVDLASRKVLARRTLSFPVGTIHLDQTAVYAAAAEGKALHALSIADLSDQHRTFLDHPVVRVFSLPGERIAVVTAGGLRCYRADGLAEVPAPGADDPQQDPRLAELRYDDRDGEVDRQSHRLNGGVLVNGVVLAQPGGEAQMLASCQLVRQAVAPKPVEDGRGTREFPPGRWADARLGALPRLWARRIEPGELLTAAGTRIADLPGGPSILLGEHPLVASARLEPSRDQTYPAILLRPGSNEHNIWKLTLDFHELVEGRAVRRRVLMPERPRHEFPGGVHAGWVQPLVADARDRVVLAFWEDLFVEEIPADILGNLSPPVHFLPKQGPLAAPVGQPVELSFVARGGRGTKTYRLLGEVEGVRLDEATGRATVNTTAVWDQFLDEVEELAEWHERRDELEGEIRAGQQAYQRLFGKPTEDVPVRLTIGLEAKDEEGQRDQLSAELILLGPRSGVDDAIAAAQATVDQRRQEMLAERPPTRPSTPPGNGSAASGLVSALQEQGALRGRIREISHRLERLEPQMRDLAATRDAPADENAARPPEELQTHLDEANARVDEVDRKLALLEEQSRRQDGHVRAALILALVVLAATAGALVLIALAKPRRAPPADSQQSGQ